VQAEQREERIRQAAEDEIEATAKRARREVLAAAEDTAPAWSQQEAASSGSGYRTF
jgi:F0F1-type ATP synthase membrane subunit b/b'